MVADGWWAVVAVSGCSDWQLMLEDTPSTGNEELPAALSICNTPSCLRPSSPQTIIAHCLKPSALIASNPHCLKSSSLQTLIASNPLRLLPSSPHRLKPSPSHCLKPSSPHCPTPSSSHCLKLSLPLSSALSFTSSSRFMSHRL